MSIALVNWAVAAGNVSTHAITTGKSFAGSTTLVVGCVEYGPSSPGALLDSSGNTWPSPLTAYGSATSRIKIYVLDNPVVSGSQTFDYGGTNCYPAVSVLGFSSTLTAGSLDQQNGNTNEGTGDSNFLASVISPPAIITPSEDNEVLVYFVGGLFTTTVTVGSGAVAGSGANQVAGAGGVNFGIAGAYEIQTTATARNPVFGWTDVVNASAAIISLKLGAAAAAGPQFVPLVSRFAPHRAAGY